jgi:superfamily II DNA or RNA helicase
MSVAIIRSMLHVPQSEAVLRFVQKHLTFAGTEQKGNFKKATVLRAYSMQGAYMMVPKRWGLQHLDELGVMGIEDMQHPVDIVSVRMELPHGLRPHQQEGYNAIRAAFDSGGNAMLCLHCGGGKTVTALYTASQLGMKCMILTHTAVLAHQWEAAIHQYCPDAVVGHVRQDKFDVEGKTHVIASLQSVSKRNYDWSSAGIGLLCIDECLPYRQLVLTVDGPVRIGVLYNDWKDAKPLPLVMSLNEESGVMETKRITHAFKKYNSKILKIKYSASTLSCTDNHRVLTVEGYKKASELQIGDLMISNTGNTDEVPALSSAEPYVWSSHKHAGFGTVRVEKITAVDHTEYGGAVFDLEVEDNHNFVACGNGGIGPVVHNCHHVAAPTLSQALIKATPRYVLGLTATPFRSDGLSPFLWAAIAPITYKVDTPKNEELRVFSVQPSFDTAVDKYVCGQIHVASMLGDFVDCSSRVELIVAWIEFCSSKNRHIIVISDRISLLELIDQKLSEEAVNKGIEPLSTAFLIGKTKQAQRAEAHLAQVILGSYSCISEGLDIRSLDTAILVTPRSGSNSIVQTVGRLLRDGGRSPLVIDIVDKNTVFQAMWNKRCKIYKRLGAVITYYDEYKNLIA